jgi:hypothetical protein
VVKVLRHGIHRELVNGPLQFQKRSQLFIRVHNETLSIIAVCVCDPDRSPFKIES